MCLIDSFSIDNVTIALFLLGIIAFIFSTLGGGGGSLLLIPLCHAFVGAGSTPQILNIGTWISRPSRLYLYWSQIQWRVVLYYVPFTLLGSISGVALFAGLQLPGLRILTALFLISTLWQYRWGKKERSFPMRIPYFAPLGFIISFISSLIGAMGPVLNPFYLNAGIQKEAMIGTKTANSFVMGIIQMASYSYFDVLSPQIWIYALALGLGAIVGNLIGYRILRRLSTKQFRQWVLFVLFLSGIFILYDVISQYF